MIQKLNLDNDKIYDSIVPNSDNEYMVNLQGLKELLTEISSKIDELIEEKNDI